MDYKDTLNLPKTDFSMKADLAKKEPEILKKWETSGLYNKIRQKNKGKTKYTLHDGPPYANGHIHSGTALNKILKDIIIKYRSMKGFDAPYIPGWDCHGLPIEFQLFKEIGTKKENIDQLDFRKKAREYALKFLDIQRQEFKRLGCIGDWENPYMTMDPQYEAQIIDVFGKLVEKGYIYKDLKPVYWCATCETALAEAEVEYKDKISSSVYVKFPVSKDNKIEELNIGKPVYLLIWTTTPWTLPANVAIALHPDFDYIFVDIGEEVIIVNKERWEKELYKIYENEKISYKVIKTKKGRELEGIKCDHPFSEKGSQSILAEFVTIDDGSGLVHIAPGHGEDDYKIGLKYGLPIFSPVDQSGTFTDEVPEFLTGNSVLKKETLDKIITYLKEKKYLWGSVGEIQHSYPHCWRCKNPIIFRATEQWFLDIDKDGLRGKLLDETNKINWVPEIGKNRISGMLEVRPDWCLSRQRYWGVPLPIFYCQGCKKPLVDKKIIDEVSKLFRKEGADSWFKYSAEQILPKGTQCKECKSEKFNKETDIFDVWFESGVSYSAVVKQNSDLNFPSDLYLEGSDQHRGWFQHSLIPCVAIEGMSPFKTVLTHGFVVDSDGKKMSKSLGNTVNPEDVIKKSGADILRLWASSQNYTEDIKISDEILNHMVDAYRKIRNTIRFLLGNLNDFNKEKSLEYKDLLDVDKFILSRLAGVIEETTSSYESFEFYKVFRTLYNFCIVDLSSFYLDISKDRLYTFKKTSKERLSCQTAMQEIAEVLIKIASPIISFTAEESWLRIFPDDKYQSVFLSEWPNVKKEHINAALDRDWSKVVILKEAVNGEIELKRKEGAIGNSLESSVKIYVSRDESYSFLKKHMFEWEMILIVSTFDFEQIGDSEYKNKKLFELKTEEWENFKIEVFKAKGEKCPRCWNYSLTVGSDQNHPELCSKCLNQIS